MDNEVKRFFIIAVLLITLICQSTIMAQPARQQMAIFIDTRLLIAAHPLFRSYDSATHRFKGTSSEYILGGAAALNELKAEISKLEKNSPQLHQNMLPQNVESAPSNVRAKLEQEYINKKRTQEADLYNKRAHLYYAMMIPGRPGITPINSIYPQTAEILSDIRAVVSKLQARHRASIVIDISSLYPYPSNRNIRDPLLLTNRHFAFWHGDFTASDTYQWVAAAKKALAGFDDGSMVIPYGAIDARLESIKLLEEMQWKGLQDK